MSRAGEHAILYVDDEAMALKYFRRSLGDQLTVHTAADAEAGLAILAEHGDRIGVLITDQRMPGASGVDLLRKVRRRWPHIVRILTTAYADLDEAIEAVNSGEIFRYITKPWDVKALRAEVNQAMAVFRLQHEHAALLREKMSVWQRLIQLGRLRDLVVMGSSLAHLRHGENAIAAYLSDHLAPQERNDLAASDYFDLWSLTESEIARTLRFVRATVERTALVTHSDERFATRLTPDQLLSLGGQAFAGAEMPSGAALPDVRVAKQSAIRLFEELAHARDASGDGCRLQAAADGAAISLSLPAASNSAADGLTAPEAASLMTAYLLAFHHGGSLERVAAGEQWKYVLTLPVAPDEITLPPPASGWLESLLVRLEGWD